MKKNFFIKLSLFFLVVILFQEVIGYLYPYKLPEHVSDLNKYKSQKIEVVYFGDSTTTWYSKNDLDVRSIQEMLKSKLPNHSVGAIWHNAYQANVYDAYTKYMVEQGYFPSFIIIPVNPRSFSMSWSFSPDSQFVDELLYLNFYQTPVKPFFSFILNLAAPEIKTIYNILYFHSPIYDGNTYVTNGAEYEKKVNDINFKGKDKLMFQADYLSNVDLNSGRMRALTNIVDRFKNTKTKVIFYITAVDYQSGEKYVGKHFTKQVDENTSKIISRLKQHGADVLDLSKTISSDGFIWKEQGYVNDHLNQESRLFVANMIWKEIEKNK